MSSVMKLINKLPELKDNQINETSNKDYKKKSSDLINEALSKGSDVMQHANGDIFITEVKTVTYKYGWNEDKNKFERMTSGSKVRKRVKKEDSIKSEEKTRELETA